MILLQGWEVSLVIQAFWKTIWSCTEMHDKTVGWGSKQLCEHVRRFSQEMKCHSTDTVQDILTYQLLTQIFSEPSFFPTHTANTGRNCALLQRHVDLKLQDTAFPHPGNAQRIQTQDVEWKQFSGKGKLNMWYGNSWVAMKGRTGKVSVALALVWNLFKCMYCVH